MLFVTSETFLQMCIQDRVDKQIVGGKAVYTAKTTKRWTQKISLSFFFLMPWWKTCD